MERRDKENGSTPTLFHGRFACILPLPRDKEEVHRTPRPSTLAGAGRAVHEPQLFRAIVDHRHNDILLKLVAGFRSGIEIRSAFFGTLLFSGHSCRRMAAGIDVASMRSGRHPTDAVAKAIELNYHSTRMFPARIAVCGAGF